MGFMTKVNEFIKQKIEEKKQMDQIYKDAYKEEAEKQMIVKAKMDAKSRINPDPNKKKTIKPIFKQGLIDDDNNHNWKMGD